MEYYSNYGKDTKSIKKILSKMTVDYPLNRFKTLMMLLCDRVELLEDKIKAQEQIIKED